MKLLKYIWKSKKKEMENTICWKVLSHVKGLTENGCCSLCLTEKFWLNDVDLLNEKPELPTKCLNENKLMISAVKD